MALLQPIVRDARVQMVHVVKADIAAEPLQHRRQLEMRAAAQRSGGKVPRRLRHPQRVLEAVLHREQPDADGRGDQHDRQLNRHQPVIAEQAPQPGDQHDHRQIGRVHRPTLAPPSLGDVEGQPVEDDEDQRRQQNVRYQRVPAQAVQAAAPAAEHPVLGQGQAGRIDVEPARAAPVEVVPDAVVSGMLAPPKGVGRQGQEAAHRPEHMIGAARAKERAMAAIVLNDKDPHQKPGRRHRQRQGHPDRQADAEAEIHRGADPDEAAEGRGDLLQAGPQDRRLKSPGRALVRCQIGLDGSAGSNRDRSRGQNRSAGIVEGNLPQGKSSSRKIAKPCLPLRGAETPNPTLSPGDYTPRQPIAAAPGIYSAPQHFSRTRFALARDRCGSGWR